MNKTFAEFFAGIGLMRMGLEKAGWTVRWANDIDPDKQKLYRNHFGNQDHFILGDVHRIDSREIPEVALATASFPCTDLSLAGARKGLDGAGSGAFWGFVNAVRGMGKRKPSMVFLENVTGFLSSHGGKDFNDACLALNSLGYWLDTMILDAASFVPQSRQRLFIVGHLGEPSPRVADRTPGFLEGPCRPEALARFIFSHPKIKWAIRDLPEPPRLKVRLSDVLEKLPPASPEWWPKERADYLLAQMSSKHRALAEAMIQGKTTTFGTVFRRVRNGISMAELRTDGIAGCLRTPKGGSGRQILFAAGRGRFAVRLLNGRECARLMGADDFHLSPSAPLNKILFGFGDAVCVPVVTWIAENHLNPLREEILENYGRPSAYPKSIQYAS
jgi:DNA (cytosine-5)-methyltransferase 1